MTSKFISRRLTDDEFWSSNGGPVVFIGYEGGLKRVKLLFKDWEEMVDVNNDQSMYGLFRKLSRGAYSITPWILADVLYKMLDMNDTYGEVPIEDRIVELAKELRKNGCVMLAPKVVLRAIQISQYEWDDNRY